MQSGLKSRKKLGEILLSRDLVTEDQIREAIALQKELGKRMGHIMLDKGWITEHDMLSVLSEQLSLPSVAIRPGLCDPAAIALLDKATASRLQVLPLIKVRDTLSVATSDPQSIPALDELESKTGLKIYPVLALQSEIQRGIEEMYSGLGLMSDFMGDLEEDFEVVDSKLPDDYTAIDQMAGASPVVTLVNTLIQRAVRDGASDVHIEPGRSKSRVRFRIDGVLYETMTPKIEMHAALVSRLKVMANLDIAERRLPQDGRIQVVTGGRVIDLRFSSLPGIFGEKVVLRVLDKNQSILDINKIGMTEANLHLFKNLLNLMICSIIQFWVFLSC